MSERGAGDAAIPEESEQRYKAIFEFAGFGVILLDLDLNVLEMNRTFREWFPRVDPVKRPRCYEVFNDPGRTSPCSWCPSVQVLADRKVHESVTSTPHPEGARHFRIRASPVLDREGNVTSIIEVVEDLTDRMRAQAALEHEQRFTSSLIRTAPTAILVLELDGRIRSCNPFFETLAGRALGEVRGLDFFSTFLPDGECESGRRAFLGSLDGRSLAGEIFTMKGPGNTTLLVEWYDAVIREENGQAAALLFTGQDVSRREASEKETRQLESQLLHSQKMETIGTLAGGIAHDFNNMLQPILGYVELAMEDVQDLPEVHANLKEVLRAGERARDLVKQILTFSRQAGAERAPLLLHLVVKEAATLLRSTIPSSIEVRPRIARCAPVFADPTQVHQVVMNLCTNAYQAMGAGPGTLEITLEDCVVDEALCEKHLDLRPGPHVRLTVADTGVGMDSATLGRIFEPFFTTKPFGKGTGLGLAVVHGIVASHGGAILVESTPGAGTSIEVYFPCAPSGTVPVEVPLAGGRPDSRGIRVLYVDDEQPILSMVRRMLGKRGIEAECVDSPLQALERFRSDPGRFDVVVTDLMMPKMTGAGFAARVVEIRPDMPVILVTGFTEDLEPGEQAGGPFVQVMRKPVGFSELTEAILSAVK